MLSDMCKRDSGIKGIACPEIPHATFGKKAKTDMRHCHFLKSTCDILGTPYQGPTDITCQSDRHRGCSTLSGHYNHYIHDPSPSHSTLWI